MKDMIDPLYPQRFSDSSLSLTLEILEGKLGEHANYLLTPFSQILKLGTELSRNVRNPHMMNLLYLTVQVNT